MTESTPKRSTSGKVLTVVGILLVLIFVFLVGTTIALHVVTNDTASEPIGFYWKSNAPDRLKYDDLVMVCIPKSAADFAIRNDMDIEMSPSSPCPHHYIYELKQVIALPGDRIEVTDQGIVRNGHLLAYTKPYRSYGSVALPHPKSEIVAAGNIWVYSPLYQSFDSRYYGPTTASYLMRPLWTFSPSAEQVDRMEDDYKQHTFKKAGA